MAKYNLDKYTKDNGFGMSLNIRRGDPNPLDNSSVWPSLSEAQTYAQTDPTAYVGQVLTVVTTEGNTKTSKVYVINNEAGDLVEVTGIVDTELSSTSTNPVQNKVINTVLGTKVDKVDGKGLSTNDLTAELKGKYDESYNHSQVEHAPANAQANIIESVKVNGTNLTVTNKAVDIAVPEYTVVKDVNSGDYAAIYHLTKGGSNVGVAINIPKDMVVKSGEVVTNPTGQTNGTYIKLELQNVDEPLYINVGSLIEYVTSGSTTGDMVYINVSDDHKVTATVTDGTITLAKLHSDVQNAINSIADKVDKTATQINVGDGEIKYDNSFNTLEVVAPVVGLTGDDCVGLASEAINIYAGGEQESKIQMLYNKIQVATTGSIEFQGDDGISFVTEGDAITFSGDVDFSDANVIGLQSTVTELTTQYVRITDLEDGIYKWVYNNAKTLYYNGEQNTLPYSFSVGDVLLFVYGTRAIDDTTKKYYKHWIAFGEGTKYTTETSVSTYYITFGYTDATKGSLNTKSLNFIPNDFAVTLSRAQTISGNKTFSGTNTHSGTETFTGAVDFADVTFSDRAQFIGDVDFTNANVMGLPSSGSADTSNDDMPTIRLVTTKIPDKDSPISASNPLTLVVEVSGAPLQIGDELQVCTRKLYTYGATDTTVRSKRYKLRRFAGYVITEADLNNNTFYIPIDSKHAICEMLRGGDKYKFAYSKYLRVRRPINDNTNAKMSQVDRFEVFGSYDETNQSSKGSVRIG